VGTVARAQEVHRSFLTIPPPSLPSLPRRPLAGSFAEDTEKWGKVVWHQLAVGAHHLPGVLHDVVDLLGASRSSASMIGLGGMTAGKHVLMASSS
jgi:hypothetical protein